MNIVIVSGRLGKDLVLEKTEKGTKTYGSIAVDESYKDKEGNKVDKVVWVNFNLYDAAAENIVKYAGKKGNRISLQGKLDAIKTDKDEYPRMVFKAIRAEYIDFNSKEETGAAAKDEAPF